MDLREPPQFSSTHLKDGTWVELQDTKQPMSGPEPGSIAKQQVHVFPPLQKNMDFNGPPAEAGTWIPPKTPLKAAAAPDRTGSLKLKPRNKEAEDEISFNKLPVFGNKN